MTNFSEHLKYIAVQGSYKRLEIALFENDKVLSHKEHVNFNASAGLIPTIDLILKEKQLRIKDLRFIALDQGPGAFTSLRSTITTLNGISFATGIPLVGVDGIDALAHEAKSLLNLQENIVLVVLLNAFNKEAYFGIYSNTDIDKGYKEISVLLSELGKTGKQLVLVGNGIIEFKQEIESQLDKNKVILISELARSASAKSIAELAIVQWKQRENVTNKLLPLYLKTQKFKPKF